MYQKRIIVDDECQLSTDSPKVLYLSKTVDALCGAGKSPLQARQELPATRTIITQ